MVLFPADGHPLPAAEDSDDDSTPIGLFLPATATLPLTWETATEFLAVWVPEMLLQEYTEKETLRVAVFHPSPLTIGFRAFARAVARHTEGESSMSKYAIERLLTEMTFGTLLEQHSVETEQRPSSLVERARSVMLLNRENPDFSTSQLAADLHISPRQLQRAFANRGTTAGNMLRGMRVELAESLLRNPLYAALTVDEVARYSGFASALQLRRALRAENAPTPSALRATVENSPPS